MKERLLYAVSENYQKVVGFENVEFLAYETFIQMCSQFFFLFPIPVQNSEIFFHIHKVNFIWKYMKFAYCEVTKNLIALSIYHFLANEVHLELQKVAACSHKNWLKTSTLVTFFQISFTIIENGIS